MPKDWLFGWLEEDGLGEVVKAEDDGSVLLDKALVQRLKLVPASDNEEVCLNCGRLTRLFVKLFETFGPVQRCCLTCWQQKGEGR